MVSIENRKLNETLSQYGISRCPLPATRITATSSTSIDVICTNLTSDKVSYEVINTGLSDHHGQICHLALPSSQKIPITSLKRVLNSKNLAAFNDLLGTQSWELIRSTQDPDEAYSNFSGILATALDIACPKKKIKSRTNQRKGRVSSDIEANRLRLSFVQAWEKYLTNGKDEDKFDAIEKKKSYDLKLKQLRKESNSTFITEAKNKNKAIWQVINSERISKKDKTEPIWRLNTPNGPVEDLLGVADLFNTFFATAAEDTLKLHNQQFAPPHSTNSDFSGIELTDFELTTDREVQNIINSMKLSSSSGMDEISSKILKSCKSLVCQPIADIINKSLVTGTFPSKLKCSKIYPLYKQGDKSDIKNYRPISLIPTVSKIVEKVILARLLNHLQSNNIFPKGQHGFIPGKSTTTALIELIEHIIDHLEHGDSITSVFLDLSKAFDSLAQDVIISKISALGVKGTALKWLKSYLTGRTQVVELSQAYDGRLQIAQSNPKAVLRGVPQGSVLGPVLFILFTADFHKHLEAYSHHVMYADDTVLTTSEENSEALEINTFISVSMAQQYCLANDLVFNSSKTKLLTLGRLKNDITGPPDLEKVEVAKHLGIILDQNLSWNDHVDHLCSKLSCALFTLRRVKVTATPFALRTAYHAMFESHIRYGIILWGGSSVGNLKRVMTLQKKAVRILTGLHPRESCRDAFKNLRILTAASIYIIEAILHASKSNLLTNEAMHHYQTRQARYYHLPVHRTSLFTKKPSFAGAALYNKLPRELTYCNPKELKRRLVNWLLDRSIYSLEEFNEIV